MGEHPVLCMRVGRSPTTEFVVWRLRLEKWGKVKEHAADRMDMPVLRVEPEAVYVSDLLKFVHDVETGCYPED